MKIFGRYVYGPFDQRTKDYKKSRKEEGGDGSGAPTRRAPATGQTTAPRIVAGFYLGPKLRKPSGEVEDVKPPLPPRKPVVVGKGIDIPRTTRPPITNEIDAALALSKPEFTKQSQVAPQVLSFIDGQLECGTVIVQAGSFHVPVLRAELRGKVNLVCMAWVPPSVRGYDPATERRMAALVNKPDILAYESGGHIENVKFDFTRYLGDLGVEIDVASAKAKSAAVEGWLDGQPRRLMRPGTSPTEVSNVRLDHMATKDPTILQWVQRLPEAPKGTLQSMARSRMVPDAMQRTEELSTSIIPTMEFVPDPKIEDWLDRLVPPKDPAP